MSKIYIAGALSSKENADRIPSKVVVDYLTNVHRMCKIAGEVRKAGHSPYVPALDMMLGVVCGDWVEEDYRGIGMEFLEVCDYILVISDSWGVQKELERARELCIPIFYYMGTGDWVPESTNRTGIRNE